MNNKHFAVLSICFGFVAILAITIACCFCIGVDIANAEVVGDIEAGNYFITAPSTIYYTNYSYDRTLTRKTFVFQDSDSEATSSISIGYFQSNSTSVIFYYDSSNPSYGSKRLYVTNGNIRFDTYNGSTWAPLFSSCFNTTSVALPSNWDIPAIQSNNGDVYRVLASVLTLDLPPVFTTDNKYMKNHNFEFGSSWGLTFSADVYLYDNVDYKNYVGIDNNTDRYYVYTQNASINVVYIDETLIQFGWNRDSDTTYSEIVTLYPDGTFRYERSALSISTLIDTGKYDFSQLIFVPQSSNFGLTGSDLTKLEYIFTNWRDFMSNFGTTVNSIFVEYPVFDSGTTSFENTSIANYGITLLDDGDLWNWYYEPASDYITYPHFRTVCNAFLDNDVVYTSINDADFLRTLPFNKVEVDGFSFNFNNLERVEVVKYVFAISYIDESSNVTPMGSFAFRSRDLGFLWYANHSSFARYESLIDSYTNSVSSFYDTNSLPAMMFAVPNVITSLLIGDWDTTSQSYTGGLFSFNILGTDLRVFFLSIVSIIILLKLVSFVIGRFV